MRHLPRAWQNPSLPGGLWWPTRLLFWCTSEADNWIQTVCGVRPLLCSICTPVRFEKKGRLRIFLRDLLHDPGLHVNSKDNPYAVKYLCAFTSVRKFSLKPSQTSLPIYPFETQVDPIFFYVKTDPKAKPGWLFHSHNHVCFDFLVSLSRPTQYQYISITVEISICALNFYQATWLTYRERWFKWVTAIRITKISFEFANLWLDALNEGQVYPWVHRWRLILLVHIYTTHWGREGGRGEAKGS